MPFYVRTCIYNFKSILFSGFCLQCNWIPLLKLVLLASCIKDQTNKQTNKNSYIFVWPVSVHVQVSIYNNLHVQIQNNINEWSLEDEARRCVGVFYPQNRVHYTWLVVTEMLWQYKSDQIACLTHSEHIYIYVDNISGRKSHCNVRCKWGHSVRTIS